MRGAGLFESNRWDLDSFLERFKKDFAFWRTDVQNHPKRLPAEWRTVPLGSSRLVLDGEPWELRMTEIRVDDPKPRRIIYVPVTVP